MMTASEKVTAFIEKQEKWQEALENIRSVFKSTELTEDFKWGAPIYTLENKNIVGMVGFKHHLGIWFYQGVFLKDSHNILVKAQRSTAKALRHWKISDETAIDYDILKQYVLEAIENQKAGKEMKPAKKASVNSPFLVNSLKEYPALQKAFSSLTRGKQNEYSEHILSAKQDATKQRRMEKITPMILAGKGLNDKYKNS